MTAGGNEGAGDRAQRAMVGWLCIGVAILEGFDLQVAGIAAPAIAVSLALDTQALGLFFSASTFGLLFGAIVGGRMADLWGRMEVLAGSCALFGIASIATGLATGAETLVAMRVLTGLGLGGALPNLIALTSQSARPGREKRAVAYLYCGVPVGGVGVSILGATMPDDWPMLFFIGGALPVLLAMVLWSRRHFAGTADSQRSGKASVAHALFGDGRAIPTLLVWTAFFAALIILYLVLNWLPILLASAGLTARHALFAQVLFNGGGFIACLASAPLFDGRHAWRVAFCAFAAIPCLLFAMALSNGTWSSLALAFLLGAAILTTQSYLYSIVPAVYPQALGGTGVGAAVAWGRIGSITGPLIGAWVLQSTNSPASVLTAIIPVAILAGVSAVAIPWSLRGRAAIAA